MNYNITYYFLLNKNILFFIYFYVSSFIFHVLWQFLEQKNFSFFMQKFPKSTFMLYFMRNLFQNYDFWFLYIDNHMFILFYFICIISAHSIQFSLSFMITKIVGERRTNYPIAYFLVLYVLKWNRFLLFVNFSLRIQFWILED
jgi:hypothetical protein